MPCELGHIAVAHPLAVGGEPVSELHPGRREALVISKSAFSAATSSRVSATSRITAQRGPQTLGTI